MKGEIKQIGIVTDDAYKSMESFWNLMGLGPWNVRHFTPETTEELLIDGQPATDEYDFIVANTWEGAVEYEIIQPVLGKNIYTDFLEKHGSGLHHFKIVIPDADELDAYVKELEDKGLKVMQKERMGNDVRCYLDSYEQLGVVVELGNGALTDEAPEVYPSADAERPVTHRQNIRQLAVVVDDAEKYMRNYARYLDIDGWDVRHFTPKRLKSLKIAGEYVTEDYDFICAVKFVGDMELEIIEPITGPNIYWEFFNKYGVGFHHIKDVCPDTEIADECERMKPYGIEVTQTGWIDGDSHYYMSTEVCVPMLLEFGNGGAIEPAEFVFYSD